MVLLPLMWIVSGLLTSVLVYPGGQEAPLFSGAIFGSFLAGCLAISGILDSLGKAAVLIAVTTAVYPVRTELRHVVNFTAVNRDRK
jgi:hypothetical protein